MKWLFQSIKGRVIVILVLFLSASHVLGLWIYAKKSEEAAIVLHDALLAEQIALFARVAERLDVTERAAMIDALSGPTVQFKLTTSGTPRRPLPEQSRGHVFEHLLAVFMGRRTHEGSGLTYSTAQDIDGLETLLTTMRSYPRAERDHLPLGPLADIGAAGAVSGELVLSDGSWITFTAPLLAVSPFTPLKLGVPLAIMIVSVILTAVWVLQRWTQPLEEFVSAAEKFGTDIYSQPLPESGPTEVQTAAKAMNLMQGRIRRFVEDRTALAAAIAHDLGTPITRLHLRAHEIEDHAVRERLLLDLDQMRRMISATLEFARLEHSAEATEEMDLTSLVQSLCDEYCDDGYDVATSEVANVTIASKPVALRRALANLLENAVKHGETAVVSVAAAPENVRIEIRDHGPGIPDHLIEEAFRPFRRLGQATDKMPGTGLGLTIAKSTVSALGGSISLANHADGGVSAIVELPRMRSRAA